MTVKEEIELLKFSLSRYSLCTKEQKKRNRKRLNKIKVMIKKKKEYLIGVVLPIILAIPVAIVILWIGINMLLGASFIF